MWKAIACFFIAALTIGYGIVVLARGEYRRRGHTRTGESATIYGCILLIGGGFFVFRGVKMYLEERDYPSR